VVLGTFAGKVPTAQHQTLEKRQTFVLLVFTARKVQALSYGVLAIKIWKLASFVVNLRNKFFFLINVIGLSLYLNKW